MIEDCTAIILAGGDSRRMGSDKANLLLGGQTLLQRAIATMRKIFPHVIVSVRQPRPEIDLPQVCDEQSHAGPLAGVAAGLAGITTPWAFAMACDMPFVMPELVMRLAEFRNQQFDIEGNPVFRDEAQGAAQRGTRHINPVGEERASMQHSDSPVKRIYVDSPQAVVPVVDGQPQPLAAFYARDCMATAQQILAGGGRHSLRALLEHLEVRYVDEAQLRGADRKLRSFFDLDTPQDVAIARRRY